MIELVPKALHLHDGPMKELARNFLRNFKQTWRRFSPSAKKPITDYFREHPGTAYLCFMMDFDSQEPYGRCAYDVGRTAVTFSAPYFALSTSDELRIAVIAHELAHIHRRGSGDWTPDNEIEEKATRDLALSWGFEAPTMRDEAHKAELNAIEAEWRDTYRSRFGRELESRWLGRSV